MESVTGDLVAIKISPSLIILEIIIIIGIGLLIFMKKRNK